MNRLPFTLALLALLTSTASAETFSADVWADNWFEMRINGEQVAEDSTPITTERSFNAERFSFEATRPFTIGFIAKDFKQNDTGLEYIGSRRQQMGDGGVKLQVKNAGGIAVAVSNSNWRCLVTHTAPLDKSCADNAHPIAGQGACTFKKTAEPENWDEARFDASTWAAAKIYSSREVRPKGGYDDINWVSGAKFIWGPDLEQSNTILCRLTVR